MFITNVNYHYMRKKTNEDFLNEAKEVHGDKYDYSKVEYISNNTNVEMICLKSMIVVLRNIF